MKRLKKLVLTAIFLNAAFLSSYAFILGSDMTWSCLGGDSFMIKVAVYNDCNGITMGNIPINFNCTLTGAMISTLILTVPTPVDITPVCHTSCTRCQSSSCSFPYGISKYLYQGIVKLNAAGSCCNIRMSMSYNGRDPYITTGAAHSTFYNEATMNRCQNPCDNSPTFTNTPIQILCMGQDITFNYNALDIDVDSTGSLEDSLTYEWTEPLSAANTPISYVGSYTYDKPIYFWGFPNASLPFPRGIHLDPHTGDIQFRAMKAEVTVMVVKVNEFRNGIKKAEIRRDLVIFIINCSNNNPPLVTTQNNVRSKNVCAGNTVAFTFETSDPNANDSVRISYNNAIPGATWTDSNGYSKHPTGYFTWTPTDSQISSLPYTFTVTARDNTCPLSSQFTQAYQITVKPNSKANLIVTDSGCGVYWFLAQRIMGSGPVYSWAGDSFTFNPSTGPVTYHKFQPGKYAYSMTMTASGCSNTYYDTLNIDTSVAVFLPKDTAVCINSTITLNASVIHGSIPYSLSWGSGKIIFAGDTTMTKQLTISRDTNIWVRASYDIYNCPFDEIMIKVHPVYKISLPDDTFLCNLNNILSPVFYPKITAFRSFKWFKQGSSVVVDSDAWLNVYDTGHFICVATDTFGCTHSDNIHIQLNPAGFASAAGSIICIGDEAMLEADSAGISNPRFYWFEGTNLIGSTQQVKVKPSATTDYKLKVMQTLHGVSCMDSTMVRVRVNPLPVIKISPIDKRCVNGPVISLNNFVTVDGLYRPGGIWTSANAGLIYGDKFNPIAAGVSSPPGWMVKYEYTDPLTGCYNKDSGYVTINSLPVTYAGPDDSICKGTKKALIGLPQIPPGTWNGTGVEGGYLTWRFNPDAAGIISGGTYNIIYHYIAYNQCENEDTVKITVKPKPAKPLITVTGDSTACFGDSVSLSSSATFKYYRWSTAETLKNIFVKNSGSYKLVVTTLQGCVTDSSDPVNVVIYPKTPTPVISLSPSDSFLVCNLSNGSYEWYYRPDSFTAPTTISNGTKRINPQLYCKRCYFSVIYTDTNGCVSDTSALFHFVVNSIDINSRLSGFVFYPNPAHNALFVENPDNESVSIMLSDIFGKTLFETQIIPGKNAISLQNYKPGLYFIFVDGIIAGKLLIE